MSLQSVCEAGKGPSSGELEVALDKLGVCIEILGKEIDELKRDILVFMHKTRHAGVDVSVSEEYVVTDSEEDDDDTAANPSELDLLRQRNAELEAELEIDRGKIDKLKKTISDLSSENFDLKREVAKLREELGNRIDELEKNRADNDAENAELKSCEIGAGFPQHKKPFSEIVQPSNVNTKSSVSVTSHERPKEKNEQGLIQELSSSIDSNYPITNTDAANAAANIDEDDDIKIFDDSSEVDWNGTSASSSDSDSDSDYDEEFHKELTRKEIARLEALEASKTAPPTIKIFDDIDFGLDDEIIDIKPVDLNHLINARSEGISILQDVSIQHTKPCLQHPKETKRQDADFAELEKCLQCDKDILSPSFEAFTVLSCGHLFHRECIENTLYSHAKKWRLEALEAIKSKPADPPIDDSDYDEPVDSNHPTNAQSEGISVQDFFRSKDQVLPSGCLYPRYETSLTTFLVSWG
ncbi:hypothetical protein C1646_756167 [Rhizophagus diaphanus]|nr:hypothetical protein C1646_756167 [Rhizophagus diaphanus] [Rhizophagus sp. MUCL 43196]